MSKITLKEISKILGISISTVSKALKNYSDINVDTKIRVQELARKYNYTPNAFAQSLRSRETKIIGILVPDLVHHFFSSIIDGAIHEAEKHGYLVIVLQSHESYEDEIKQLKLLVDKILMASCSPFLIRLLGMTTSKTSSMMGCQWFFLTK